MTAPLSTLRPPELAPERAKMVHNVCTADLNVAYCGKRAKDDDPFVEEDVDCVVCAELCAECEACPVCGGVCWS